MGFLAGLFGKGDAVPQVQQVRVGGQLREMSPEGELERSIVALRAGQAEIQEVAGLLVKARVFVPSPQNPDAKPDKTGFKPVVVELPEGLFVPAYTSLARAEVMHAQNLAAASGIETEGAWIVKNLPDDLGLYINPGWKSCLMLPAVTLARMREHFDL